MDRGTFRPFACGFLLSLGCLVAGSDGAARAQEPPPPTPPSVNPPSAPDTSAPATTREAELEARIRKLESLVESLSSQVSAGAAAGGGTAPGGGAGTASPDVGTPATAAAPSGMGGAGAPGQSNPPNPPPSARFDSPATLDSIKGNVKFGPGFEIRTDDDEYIFQFHDLTQLDYRGYLQGGQTTIKDTFAFPRQWFMFSGRLSKPFGYFVSLANGFDTLSILDVFADVDYDPRFRIRAGRFKTPFTYEFFVEPVQGLVIPERSMFFNNFGMNRDIGFMAFGRLANKTVDYAAGLFNGSRNGFIDQDNSKDVAAFLNYRPFGNNQDSIFENFNIGGSVFAGNEDHAAVPQTFRTVVPTTGNALLGVPFLGLNSNVIESGHRAFWDLHTAWYYKQLAFVGEWGSGDQSYALAGSPSKRTQVGVQSFYLQASYLLTGETRSSIGIVKPKNPFDIRKGKFGTGAIEPFFRYEYMDIGQEVFTHGLADPNNWAHRLFATHVGLNWHLTQYIKMYFDWNHDEFNNPVVFAPGRRQLTSDMFLLRLQIYF
ncbi:MAG TPA: porin [Isosphaeraceae bacterium]|nr:porin [Isosphaeraceae bacterium]